MQEISKEATWGLLDCAEVTDKQMKSLFKHNYITYVNKLTYAYCTILWGNQNVTPNIWDVLNSYNKTDLLVCIYEPFLILIVVSEYVNICKYMYI